MDLKEMEAKLKRPFQYSDIEWRISRIFKSGKATVLAYITSRAVMDRLDEVFGIDGWQDEYSFIDNNVTCQLKVLINDTWISKMDGAPQTNFESFKGGISDAMKRCAVKFGIGRYLYNLTESWVTIQPEKPHGVDKKYIHFINDENKSGIKGYWISPELPNWALPEGTETKKTKKANPVFETFKDEMRKVYTKLGKDKFYAKLGSLGYENVDDLENAETKELDKTLKEMISEIKLSNQYPY